MGIKATVHFNTEADVKLYWEIQQVILERKKQGKPDRSFSAIALEALRAFKEAGTLEK